MKVSAGHAHANGLFTSRRPWTPFRSARSSRPPPRAAAETQNIISDAELALRSWIKSKGGAIHPNLRLVEHAPCGCRGIVATAPIEGNRPVVQIPLTCRLTPAVALDLLQPALSAAGMPSAGGLGEEMQLALALAYLRTKVRHAPKALRRMGRAKVAAARGVSMSSTRGALAV
jgi:hypothetical protein